MARIMVGAGGTGGHIYPALAVVEALYRHNPSAHKVTFVGSSDGFERPLIEQSNVQFSAYHEIMAGPLNGVGIFRALSSAFKMVIGTAQAARILVRQTPQALLLTGGWANVPLALAASLLRVPILVYLPDIEPGKTIEFLARIAQKVAITVPDSTRYFKAGQTVVTGYPLRQSLLNATREQALAHFQLDAHRPVLLVFGGSRGARSINLAVERVLPALLADDIQVLHVTGTLDWERSQEATASVATGDYHPFAYLHDDMGLAMAVADLVVCRSGASTLGELPHFGLPSILVPYPHAWQYQKTNADYLAQQGAGIRVNDEKMDEELLPILRNLFTNRVQLEKMKTSTSKLSSGNGADAIAQQLIQLAGETS